MVMTLLSVVCNLHDTSYFFDIMILGTPDDEYEKGVARAYSYANSFFQVLQQPLGIDSLILYTITAILLDARISSLIPMIFDLMTSLLIEDIVHIIPDFEAERNGNTHFFVCIRMHITSSIVRCRWHILATVTTMATVTGIHLTRIWP